MTTNAFSDHLSCRNILNIMVILGFMLNYMLRVNLTIAIVSMVIPSNSSSQRSNESLVDECFSRATINNLTSSPIINVTSSGINETNNDTVVRAFPQWHSVRWVLYKSKLIRLMTRWSQQWIHRVNVSHLGVR